MKQNKFPIINMNEPKKIAAIAIFILAFLAFIWEIISGFGSREQIKSNNKEQSISLDQEPIKPDSPLFTTALFGVYVPANLSDADIKQSMLDVQVLGIMFSVKNNESQVVLRAGGGKEQFYMVGDTLPGGAVIKRISPKGVVVLHNGALESLSLPKNELIFDLPAKPLIKE